MLTQIKDVLLFHAYATISCVVDARDVTLHLVVINITPL